MLIACSDDTSVAPTPGKDGGPDVRSDSPTNPETGSDTGTDAPFDGGFQVDTFDTVVADALCKSLARCCYGNPLG